MVMSPNRTRADRSTIVDMTGEADVRSGTSNKDRIKQILAQIDKLKAGQSEVVDKQGKNLDKAGQAAIKHRDNPREGSTKIVGPDDDKVLMSFPGTKQSQDFYFNRVKADRESLQNIGAEIRALNEELGTFDEAEVQRVKDMLESQERSRLALEESQRVAETALGKENKEVVGVVYSSLFEKQGQETIAAGILKDRLQKSFPQRNFDVENFFRKLGMKDMQGQRVAALDVKNNTVKLVGEKNRTEVSLGDIKVGDKVKDIKVQIFDLGKGNEVGFQISLI